MARKPFSQLGPIAKEFWTDSPRPDHKYVKRNLVTNSDMTDTYECEVCGCLAKRHGFEWPPQRVGVWRAEKYQRCPGKQERNR